MKNILDYLRENYPLVLVLTIVVLATILRIQAYGDIKLSIAGNDTQSYIDASKVPVFSSEMLTGRRLLTTNLLYKIFEPQEEYEILVNGSLGTTRRVVQPSFTGIVIFQLAFSIIGWGFLAFVVAENLRDTLTKSLASAVILLFAFTPQMADWDSILMSESLTFSMFALESAILIKMAFLLYKNQNAKITLWFIAWAIIHFFWTFLRDTNLFTSIVTIFMLVVVLISTQYRKNKYILSSLLFLSFVFIFGFITSSNSTRSQVQLINIYHDDFFSSPLRTEILREMGMPQPYTEEYNSWFQDHATKTLIRFMLTHPGYPTVKIIKDFPISFNEIKQTYFKAPELNPAREVFMSIGDALHPENTTPFLISLLLLIALLQFSFKNIGDSRIWLWIGLWLFLTSSMTLIPTILGDTWAINRHALFSTMLYRMFMWVFTIVLIDIGLTSQTYKEKLKA